MMNKVENLDEWRTSPAKPCLAARFQQAVLLIDQFKFSDYLDKTQVGRETALYQMTHDIVDVINENECREAFEEAVYKCLVSAFGNLNAVEEKMFNDRNAKQIKQMTKESLRQTLNSYAQGWKLGLC